jgi:5-hydroxyisourate hydrolase
MPRLSTHVLDVSAGKPARALRVRLLRHEPDGQVAALADLVTNDDGRTAAPLLDGAALVAGRYRLCFHVGDYFRALGQPGPEPAFLDVVEIAFGIPDATQNYHVPLLVSPWSYSTYRGS